MNQTILRPAPEQELPDWLGLEQRERKDYKGFRTVPDFDQMLLNVAKNNKVIPIRARYVYLPEQAGQIRSSIQAGLERLPDQPSREPPGLHHPTPQNPAPAAPTPTRTTNSEAQTTLRTIWDPNAHLDDDPEPKRDEDMDQRRDDSGAASSTTSADTIAQMLQAHQAKMAQTTAVQDRARSLE